jgi:hypothetical protein
VVSGTGGEHFLDHGPVTIHPLGLVERTFVIGEAKPEHAVENRPHGVRSRSRQIGVLDAQDEGAGVVAGIGP